jgi:hypothetical protein
MSPGRIPSPSKHRTIRPKDDHRPIQINSKRPHQRRTTGTSRRIRQQPLDMQQPGVIPGTRDRHVTRS